MIVARAMYPCQDTPKIKFAWRAEVTCRNDLDVFLSAVKVKRENVTDEEGKETKIDRHVFF